MKYESTILKRLIDTYGVVGNPRYISEIIKEFIVRGKECFPNLFTYQADWLAHIDEFGLNPTYTVSYTGQSIYAPNTLERPVKSAILKGSTKYRDIDTGEFLETFEEGRNLELVSVKMPVLTTTGKNLVSGIELGGYDDFGNKINGDTYTTARCTEPIYIGDGETFYAWMDEGGKNNIASIGVLYHAFDKNKKWVRSFNGYSQKITLKEGECYIVFRTHEQHHEYVNGNHKMMVSKEPITSYEPYKSNILTVNEDVTLRSNGDICDELNLLTGQLTQRIGEDGVVLSQEVVKTVDLSILDQNGQNVKQLMSFNGGTHFNTTSLEGSPLPVVSVSVETDLEETLMMCSLEGYTM